MLLALLSANLLCSPASAGGFKLTSSDIVAGKPIAAAQVFNGFGCTGDNIAPALAWTGAPEGTQSYAVLVHDPDAPTGGAGWWHWLVYNIPATAAGLPGGGAPLPPGVAQAVTDFGAPGWGGPCPPAGDKAHRYNFTVYALKVPTLDIPAGSSASLVGFMVNANSLAKAQLTGTYGR